MMTIDFLIGAIRASRDLHPQVKTELEEILHQAEPRLLTVEEINEMKAGTPLVVERKIEHNGRIVPLACWGINSGSLIFSFHGTMFPDTVHEIPYKTISTNESTGKSETHLFRFWNTMPERDQMCGTPWEKEGKRDVERNDG